MCDVHLVGPECLATLRDEHGEVRRHGQRCIRARTNDPVVPSAVWKQTERVPDARCRGGAQFERCRWVCSRRLAGARSEHPRPVRSCSPPCAFLLYTTYSGVELTPLRLCGSAGCSKKQKHEAHSSKHNIYIIIGSIGVSSCRTYVSTVVSYVDVL